jgi:NTP pyrophosphatase (non-canonical NTP hydrolase)
MSSENMEKVNGEKKKEYVGPKKEIPKIMSLAMLKMEKNFIAVIDKGYCRQPYSPEANQPLGFMIFRLKQELEELEEAFKRGDLINMREELADISNLCDYTDEELLQIMKQQTFRRGMKTVFELNKGGKDPK